MSVTLRERKRKNGKTALFLDIYDGGNRRMKYLKIYLTGDRDQDRAKRKLAERLRAEEEMKLLRGEHGIVDASSTEFGEFFRDLGERKIAMNRATWRTVHRHWKRFHPKPLPISNLDEKIVARFQEYLRERVVENTVWGYMTRFSAAINVAVKKNLIPRNPVHDIDRARQQDVSRDFLSPEELSRFLKAKIDMKPRYAERCTTFQDHKEIKEAFIFSCYTGLRISDIRRLNKGKIKDRSIQAVQKKTGSAVYNPLHPVAWKIIEPRLVKDGPLFDLPKEMTLWRWLKRWQKAAGIEKNISFHTSRHTFAMMALKSSRDIYSVSKLMGHSNLKTTEIYLRILDDSKRTTIEGMPGIEM